MNIGDRIKQRRITLGMSVDDLAIEVNKNRATIYRYEKGDIENLPTTVIEPLAKALETTPEYLMGWTDDPRDYENDPDIQVPREALKMGITPEQWDAFKRAESMDSMAYSQSMYMEDAIPNPDIRLIARAGHKMTPEQAEQLRRYAEFMFPEAFNDSTDKK